MRKRYSALMRCVLLSIVLSSSSCWVHSHNKQAKPFNVARSRTPVSYTVIDLGTLPGYNVSTAQSINDKGQIVGTCIYRKNLRVIGDDLTCAFEWHSRRLHDLQVLPHYNSSIATSINNQGLIVGASYNSFSNQGHAVLWQSGRIADLGSLPHYSNSTAMCINNAGQVVGYSSTGRADRFNELVYHAFFWQRGRMQQLGALGGRYSSAYAINDYGLIVGKADLPPRGSRMPSGNVVQPGLTHAFVWQSHQLSDLKTLPQDSYSQANKINNISEVVGFSSTEIAVHAALWQGGKITRLASMNDDDVSMATCINNQEQVVGCWHDSSMFAREHACIWQNRRFQTLDDAIPIRSGWALEEATGINSQGQIVGNGLHNGKKRAFLLTPKA